MLGSIMTVKKITKQNKNYYLDPVTSRATFIKNNKAAMTHGGYSRDIPQELIDAALENDFGYEVGVLKGQLTNLLTIGNELVDSLYNDGEKARALSVALSCADRASRLVPQIQKAIEGHTNSSSGLTAKQKSQRKRVLKKLADGNCTALDVAYQFATQELGELPSYVNTLLSLQLKTESGEQIEELISKEEIRRKLEEYWQEAGEDQVLSAQRKQQVDSIKTQINSELFNVNEKK